MAKLKLKLKNNKKSDKNISLEVKDHILKSTLTTLMLDGLSFEDSVKSLSLSKTQVSRLQLDPVFQDFIDKVSIDFEHRHLSNVNTAGDAGNWKASAWMLERLRPDKYGKKDTIRLEYNAKLVAFKNVMLEVLNACDPSLKQKVMQKLRMIDVDSKVQQIGMQHIEYNQKDDCDIIDIDLEE